MFDKFPKTQEALRLGGPLTCDAETGPSRPTWSLVGIHFEKLPVPPVGARGRREIQVMVTNW
jgi:hypothetical protein